MIPYYNDGQAVLYHGDAIESLDALPANSVQTCVTSPPYWGLRDYGTAAWDGGDPECEHGVQHWDGPKQTQGAQSGHASKADKLARTCCPCGARRVDQQIGLEESPDAFVAKMVDVFRAVRRVLRDDGTVWCNLGDSYAGSWGAQGCNGEMADRSVISARQIGEHPQFKSRTGARGIDNGLKPKDLVGIPWRVAFALQADGWYLRSDIIWAKPNPMPESVTDRPTKSHEYLFLLTKRANYYYDADAIREPAEWARWGDQTIGKDYRGINPVDMDTFDEKRANGRNKRTVWTIATESYPEAHFATFPTALVKPCILAGSREGDTVLDPFAGSGTTLQVAKALGRKSIGIDLNAEYLDLAVKRVQQMALEAI